MRQPLDWQLAAVKSIRPETAKVKTFTLTLPNWTPHRAGQHYDVRLTAEDGYQAQRSYSIASEPERRGEIDLTVERIEDGEVSACGVKIPIVMAPTSPFTKLVSVSTTATPIGHSLRTSTGVFGTSPNSQPGTKALSTTVDPAGFPVWTTWWKQPVPSTATSASELQRFLFILGSC